MSEVGYMLDTNVFNSIANGEATWIAGSKIFATHVQRDELLRTKDSTRRQQLLQIFTDVGPASIHTETAIWDDSRWDEAKWSAEDGVYEQLSARITELDGLKGKKRNQSLNISRDARIAETALKNGLTLVTNDTTLVQAMMEARGRAISFADLTSK